MTSNLDRHIAALAADPSDPHAFHVLQESYFLAADWDRLAALYRQRLQDPGLTDAGERASVHYQLGQILEERCLDIDLAIEQYTESVRLDPHFGPGLRQLRKVHASRDAWDMVLQIAELEIETLSEPYEQAAFFAEMGHVWLRHLSDANEAMTCFEQSLGIDPNQKDALAGLARTLEAQGNPEAAAATWERLIGNLRGPDRAAPQVALASLLAGPLHQGERAVELYRRALSDDPRNEPAVEALSVSAAARGQWDLLSDLYERRFSLAAGARRRTAIALEAAYMQLEQIGNLDASRIWIERADEMSGDDGTVLAAYVDLERECGNDDALARCLDRLISIQGRDAPLRYLLEAAGLHTERAEDELALRCLEMAQRQAPDDALVLESLGETYHALRRHEDLAAVLERRVEKAEHDLEEHATLLIELGYVQVTHLGNVEAALIAYERAFTVCPTRSGLATTLESLYRKTEKWDPLRSLLERAVESGAEHERAGFHCSLGELLENRFDDPAASAAHFEASLDLAPSPRALEGLSRLADRSGDPDAIRRALEREAELISDPERIAVIGLELGARYEEAGDLETALSWLERSLGAASDSREGLEAMARVQERLGRDDDLTRTLIGLEEVLRGSEQSAVRRRIAALHESRGDDDATATTWWERSLEAAPDDLEALTALRRHYHAQNRFEELAPVLRRLADASPPDAQAAYLDELSRLLDERLCDLDGAIVVLWRLADSPDRTAEVATRLESLLERAGRFEELAQQLLERRRSLPDDGEEAAQVDLRRAQLLLDPLGQFEEATVAFRAVRLRQPDLEAATSGLERALRASNDYAGLARLLEEIAEGTSDPSRREVLLLERAELFEEELGELEQARQAYVQLCGPETRPETLRLAETRLESLLERCGDWAALRSRLEARAELSDPKEKLTLHERVAQLCLDRMEDTRGAITHLEAVGEIDPLRAHPWRTLAGIYQDLGRSEDLLRVTEAELATSPDAERERVLHSRAADLWVERPGEEENACGHYERLLELEPGRADAIEFLVSRYEAQQRFADVARLLETRLEAIASGSDADANRGLQTSLRLRIATLKSEELDDPEGAILVLEAAVVADGPAAPAAEPLAELYRSCDRSDDLIELCEAVSAAIASPEERAIWQHRLAVTLRAAGRDADAIDAFRRVLDERPTDTDARTALADLYRSNGHAGPLVDLLEDSLAGATAADESVVRMELARLLEQDLARPDDALTQLRRVLELEGDHEIAFGRAVDLANACQHHDVETSLIEARLERGISIEERTGLLERRAGLLAGPLDAPEAALSAYREVIALAPHSRTARRSLREVLEGLGRWTAVLDCLYVDAEGADPEERAAIYEQAVEIATAQVSQDAALPWLERLRGVRPTEPLVVARIADVHRVAGRFESVLRALEDELALTSDAERERDLHIGRARILERDMDAPGRAIAALEAARALYPQDPEVLLKLEELYAATARAREHAEVIEVRLGICDDDDRLRLHLAAADLYSGPLTEPDRAIPHLLRAVDMTGADTQLPPGHLASRTTKTPSTPNARCALLGDLAATLRATGREEAWARAARAELAAVISSLADRPPENDDPRVARRNVLHYQLAHAHADRLANPAAAMDHLRTLMSYAQDQDAAGLSAPELGRVELRLLDLLRRDANCVELEHRLSARVARGEGRADEWLELARLRDEHLNSPAAARDAYAQSVELDPHSLPAIRALRSLSERLDDWQEVARTIDLELALPAPGSDADRGALQRRLGEICWRRLHAGARATAAYRNALDAEPRDLEALRALQQLHESHNDWETAANLYEREADLLEDADPARRKQVWLAAATLYREHCEDPRRALTAYEHAAAVSALDPEPLRAQADLYEQVGDPSNFAECWGTWCDADGSGATCADHLLLVDTFVELNRPDDATTRCKLAIEADTESADAWTRLARLHLDQQRSTDAADAWERAGELRHGPEAAVHLCDAALLVESTDAERCSERLRRAVDSDPALAAASAHLARVACELGSFEEAEGAAIRALDLAAVQPAAASSAADDTPGSQLEMNDALQLETAMAGGRAARALDRLESAVLFYGAALDLAPESAEALEAYGELLFERGDLAAARGALEARIEMEPDERHASRLAMLGSVLELAGEPDDALEHFRDAVRSDPTCAAAQAGVARLCEKADRTDEGIEALAGWARACRDSGDRRSAAARLLRAAEIELDRGRPEAARGLLDQSIEDFADNARAWVLLAELHADADDVDALIEHVPGALSVDAVTSLPDAVARLSILHARALEQRDDPAAACEAYDRAVRHDSRCTEAALSRARLQRLRGDWQDAADGLRDYAEHHPELDHYDLAEVHYKLARLLSGPLEDMESAIRCFERALEIAPDHPKARGPLASLLAVMPGRWSQAIAQHAALLQDDPTHAPSYRALIHIVQERGSDQAARFGLAVLRSLGATAPAERDAAPDRLPSLVASDPTLSDDTEEIARRLVQHAAETLEPVLGTPPAEEAAVESRDFVVLRDRALRELCAPGLEKLSDEELGDLLVTLAGLALGDETDTPLGDGILEPAISRGLDRGLGRWSRRKMRRVLDGTTLDQIRAIDPSHFRLGVNGLAAAVAVDLGQGDLRGPLVTLCTGDAPPPDERDDLSELITASSDATELLRRVAAAWCAEIRN